MSTVTDLTGAVIDYLVAQCQASTSLGAATPPVAVFDGPTADEAQLAGSYQRMWIGADGRGGPGAIVQAASSDQAFAFLDKAQTRDNKITVNCAAEYADGDPTAVKSARDGVYALVAVVEDMLRGTGGFGPGDATMGGLVYWSQVASGELAYSQNSGGVAALLAFKVTAFARLTS